MTAIANKMYKEFLTRLEGVITTRFRAAVAFAMTGSFAILRLHPITWGKPVPWTWMYAGILPTWAVVIINVVFYGYIIWLGVVFALSAMRKEEQTIWLAVCVTIILTPVRVLFPRVANIARGAQAWLALLAFLAAVALLASFWEGRESKKPS